MKNNQGFSVESSAAKTSSCLRFGAGRAKLVRQYRQALTAYLKHRDDDHLRFASELGGMALNGGMGLFDLARLHEETIAKARAGHGTLKMNAQRNRAAEIFLLDALSPFTAAQRGLPDAYVRLSQITEALEQRNQALAIVSAKQCQAEAALLTSKKRSLILHRQTRSLKADLLQHSNKVIQAREAERKRVSRELHDEIGQALAAVNVGLSILKKQASHDRAFQRKVVATQALIERSMESVHRFARGLRPEMLDLLGPFEAIGTQLKVFSERTGIPVTIHSEADLAGLDGDQEIALFRVAQESITNIIKHAHATHVDVRFFRQAEGICMEIQDDGRSFSVAEKLGPNSGKRLGLLGMQERVQLARGEFTIESAIGSGTKLRVSFPCGTNHQQVRE